MFIHTGAHHDTVWAVSCVGADGQQIAALTSFGVVIWNSGESAPVQVLPWDAYENVHARLSASTDGTHFLAVRRNRFQLCSFSNAGWSLAPDEEYFPGLCSVQFGGPTALRMMLLRRAGDVPAAELHLCLRQDDWHGRTREVTEEIEMPAGSFTCSGGADLHAHHYYASDLSADGRWYLASAGEKLLHVWHTPDRAYVGNLKLRGICNEARFAPDGELLAVDVGTSVYFCRTDTLDIVSTWKVKYCYVPHLAWSPDGRQLARADSSSTVRVLDVESGKEASALSVRGKRATSVAYSPDGLTRLVGTAHGEVIVWDVE